MILTDALRYAITQLADGESPRLDAEVLLMHVLRCSRTHLHAWPEQTLTDPQQTQFFALITRRAAGEPVAHLTGMREFWSLPLQVSPDTLIPRPDTELLVELALARIPPTARWHIADLGTGSGAIALAIASERPLCSIIAIDQSDSALLIARANAARLALHNVSCLHGNWLEGFHQHFDMIVTNPPYIAANDPHLAVGDVRFEPLGALTSGIEGLDDIDKIITDTPRCLSTGGWLLIEHGYDQAAAVAERLQSQGFERIETVRDLGDNDRVTMGQLVKPGNSN